MFGRSRRERAMRKVKPGDGSALGDFRAWHLLWRGLFTIEHDGAQYALDVDYFDLDGRARLYRDGSQHAVAEMPAAFPVGGGVIESATTMFGMKRAHLVLDDGPERQLRPAPGTAEAWRARLASRHPALSRILAWSAVIVLLAALPLAALQLVEFVSSLDVVADRIGVFTSPVSLPPWLNTTVLVAGVLAATERALTLRNHWLIDADTWWLGD